MMRLALLCVLVLGCGSVDARHDAGPDTTSAPDDAPVSGDCALDSSTLDSCTL